MALSLVHPTQLTPEIMTDESGVQCRVVPVTLICNGETRQLSLPVDWQFSVIKEQIANEYRIPVESALLFASTDPLDDNDTFENCASLVSYRASNDTYTALPPDVTLTLVQDTPIDVIITYNNRKYLLNNLSLSYSFSALIGAALHYFGLQRDSSQYHLSMGTLSFDPYQTLFGSHLQSGTRLTLTEGEFQTSDTTIHGVVRINIDDPRTHATSERRIPVTITPSTYARDIFDQVRQQQDVGLNYHLQYEGRQVPEATPIMDFIAGNPEPTFYLRLWVYGGT